MSEPETPNQSDILTAAKMVKIASQIGKELPDLPAPPKRCDFLHLPDGSSFRKSRVNQILPLPFDMEKTKWAVCVWGKGIDHRIIVDTEAEAQELARKLGEEVENGG